MFASPWNGRDRYANYAIVSVLYPGLEHADSVADSGAGPCVRPAGVKLILKSEIGLPVSSLPVCELSELGELFLPPVLGIKVSVS